MRLICISMSTHRAVTWMLLRWRGQSRAVNLCEFHDLKWPCCCDICEKKKTSAVLWLRAIRTSVSSELTRMSRPTNRGRAIFLFKGSQREKRPKSDDHTLSLKRPCVFVVSNAPPVDPGSFDRYIKAECTCRPPSDTCVTRSSPNPQNKSPKWNS